MPTSGPFYTFAQLEQLWINAGGSTASAPVAAAVALAESGGGAGSTNPTDNGGRQTSWGLWQISNGTHAQPVPNILDPTVNAGQAVGKWRAAGQSFARDWGTYTSGAYLRYLQNGVPPSAAGVPSTPGTTTPGGSSGGASATLTADTSSCLINIPGINVCVLTRTEARALIGGLILGAGVLVGVVGLVVLISGHVPTPISKAVPTPPPAPTGTKKTEPGEKEPSEKEDSEGDNE